jgi:hypothetical protein
MVLMIRLRLVWLVMHLEILLVPHMNILFVIMRPKSSLMNVGILYGGINSVDTYWLHPPKQQQAEWKAKELLV